MKKWASIFFAVNLFEVLSLNRAASQVAPECKYGIDGPNAKPLPTLALRALDLLSQDERIVGTWLDRCGVCSIVVITNAAGRGYEHFDVCADGSSSRDGTSKNSQAPLRSIKPPAGAKRAWQTPGLTCRSAFVLGHKTTECLTATGDRQDRNTFVENIDGTLLQYQDGIGLAGDKVVVRAAPLDLRTKFKNNN